MGAAVETGSPVRAVAFDSAGRSLVSVEEDGTVRLWDVPGGRRVGGTLKVPAPGRAVAVSPDDRAVLVGCADGIARLYRGPVALHDPAADLAGFSLTRQLPHTAGFEVSAVAFHPHPHGGQVLTGAGAPGESPARTAEGGAGEACLWDAATGAPARRMGHRLAVRAVAFSPAGDRVATGSGSAWIGEARVWARASGLPLQGGLFHHVGEVYAVAFSPDGRFLASGGQDRSVRVWDARTFQPVGQPLWHTRDVRAVALTGDMVVSAGDEDAARVWAVAPGLPKITSRAIDDSPVTAAAALPDCGRVWVGRLSAGRPALDRLTVGPGGMPGRPSPWRGEAAAADVVLPQPVRVIGAVSTPAGVRVVVAGGTGEAGYSAVYDGEGHPLGAVRSHPAPLRAVAVDQAGKWVATGSDEGDVAVWPTGDGAAPARWQARGHAGRVYVVAFSPDGRWLLSGGRDGRLAVWEVGEKTPAAAGQLPDAVVSAAFSPDGRRVLVGYAGGARLFRWDGSPGGLRPEGAALAHQAGILRVATDPAGRTAVTGGTDGKVRWWDLAGGLPLGPAWPHPELVREARFGPGNTLFTAATDQARGVVAVWRLPPPVAGSPAAVADWVRAVTGVRFRDGVSERLAPAEWKPPPPPTTNPADPFLVEAELSRVRAGAALPPVNPVRPAERLPPAAGGGPGPPDPSPAPARVVGGESPLVGEWKLMRSGGTFPITGLVAGSVIRFGADGTLAAENADRMIRPVMLPRLLKGSYAVENDTLKATLAVNGETVEGTFTVKKLTADALLVEGKDGKFEELRRVSPQGGAGRK